MTDAMQSRSDAVRALEDARLLDHDEDHVVSGFDERDRPLAVSAPRDATDLSLAWWDDVEGRFETVFFDGLATALVARAMAGRKPLKNNDYALLVQAMEMLDEIASACDLDARLRARFGGLAALRTRLRDRIREGAP